jgi:hypothetical protein
MTSDSLDPDTDNRTSAELLAEGIALIRTGMEMLGNVTAELQRVTEVAS